VLVAADLPHLSHLGVRARQERLPFAACADAGLVASEVGPLIGKRVRLHVTADGVRLKVLPPSSDAAAGALLAAEEAGGDWSDDELSVHKFFFLLSKIADLNHSPLTRKNHFNLYSYQEYKLIRVSIY
jgi:hypothetical protein